MKKQQFSAGLAPLRARRGISLTAFLCLAVGLLWFGWMAVSVQQHTGLAALDQPLHDWAVGVRTGFTTAVLAVVTTVADTLGMVLLTLAAALFLLFRTRTWRRPALLLSAMLGGILVSNLAKTLFDRTRPDTADMALTPLHSPSFPSGHTMGATLFAASLAYLVIAYSRRRSAAVWALVFAVGWPVLVAFSRVYLGFHWLTDTLAAMGLGLAVVGVMMLVDLVLTRRRAVQLQPQSSSTPEAA